MNVSLLKDRFMDKFIPVTESGCWLWTASTWRGGYGQFRVGKHRNVQAHRFSYELFKGPIPKGLVLDHLCRVPLCVNPDHLEPVTIGENVMRGETVAARMLARTHCLKGHELCGENLVILRVCRTCRNHQQNAKNKRKRVRSNG